MTTTATTTPASIADVRSPLLGWLAVVLVMLGIFSIVTTEILPIGLLTAIGASFGVTDGIAGLMMTMPGFLAAVAAPTVTVATARLDRRVMLCILMLVLAAANFLSAAASHYWVLLVARVLVGIVIGGFWSIGSGLAGRLVPDRSVPRANALIFSAVPLGSVLGVPAGTAIGQLAGWRVAFVALGVLAVGVFVALVLVVPALPAHQATRLGVLRTLLRRSSVRVGLLATFLIVLAHFGTYTYVTLLLEQVTQVSPEMISMYLLVYGAAGIGGNFLAGMAISRSLRATFRTAAALIAAATLLLPVLGQWEMGALVMLIGWGLGYGAVPVCSATWFARSASDAAEAASVLFTASFQATLSLGALVGGVIVDTTSITVALLLGGILAALMALTLVRERRPG